MIYRCRAATDISTARQANAVAASVVGEVHRDCASPVAFAGIAAGLRRKPDCLDSAIPADRCALVFTALAPHSLDFTVAAFQRLRICLIGADCIGGWVDPVSGHLSQFQGSGF